MVPQSLWVVAVTVAQTTQVNQSWFEVVAAVVQIFSLAPLSERQVAVE